MKYLLINLQNYERLCLFNQSYRIKRLGPLNFVIYGMWYSQDKKCVLQSAV